MSIKATIIIKGKYQGYYTNFLTMPQLQINTTTVGYVKIKNLLIDIVEGNEELFWLRDN